MALATIKAKNRMGKLKFLLELKEKNVSSSF